MAGRKGGVLPLTVSAVFVVTAAANAFYSSGGVVRATAAASGPPGRLGGEDLAKALELDPHQLPVVPPTQDLWENPTRFPSQPQECAYSSKDGEEASIRLIATPGQGVSFRCPGDTDDFSPDSETHAFLVRSDGSCDTSKAVRFADISAPFRLQSVEAGPGESVSHKEFAVFEWPFGLERQLCYVCKGKAGGQNAGKTCTVFLQMPPAPHVTDIASCDWYNGRQAFAMFRSDEESDLSVAFTCSRGQKELEPDVTNRLARTGDYCRSTVPLTDVADGASLTKTGSTEERDTYKLTLKSLPKSPRLFCFRCLPSDISDASGCLVFVYAPTAKPKSRDGGGQVPDPKGQVPDPKGQVPDPNREEEMSSVVVSTTTKSTSSSSQRGPSWSFVMYITFFPALLAGIANTLSV
ncbi:sag-related sequence srs17b [Cystoisospora suis]|uniref:Sag-related sequence srs17b n=1 Tax=Cystoisospora suis TaxID=483139 RepID=A0A2C6L6V8_9APIC|nr:sag-related sequence srs17b [Cystoisospora suis]